MTGKKNSPAKEAALMGMLFAMAMALSFAESLLPVLPMLPPGFKLGLSNIVTMYTLFVLGTRKGFAIAVLKSFFVLLTRAPIAAFMSLCGGLLSVLCMALCSRVKWLGKDYMLLSVIGALAHNLGQLLAAAAVLRSWSVMAYLPYLIIAAVLAGLFTGIAAQALVKRLDKMQK